MSHFEFFFAFETSFMVDLNEFST